MRILEEMFWKFLICFWIWVEVLQPSANGGQLCSGNLSIVRGCQIQSCPVQAGEISKDAVASVTGISVENFKKLCVM